MQGYAKIYSDDIVSLHEKPLFIISNRGAQFTFRFLKSFIKGLSSKVKIRTVFHPQMDGKAGTSIQTPEDMLRACVIHFKGNWDNHLLFIKFSYNNSYHLSNSMEPFEALYGKQCRSRVGWFKVGESSLFCTEIIHDAFEKVWVLRDRLKILYIR